MQKQTRARAQRGEDKVALENGAHKEAVANCTRQGGHGEMSLRMWRNWLDPHWSGFLLQNPDWSWNSASDSPSSGTFLHAPPARAALPCSASVCPMPPGALIGAADRAGISAPRAGPVASALLEGAGGHFPRQPVHQRPLLPLSEGGGGQQGPRGQRRGAAQHRSGPHVASEGGHPGAGSNRML